MSAKRTRAMKTKNPPVDLMTQCITMKESGAENARAMDLADVLVRKFSSTKLVFILPDDPYDGVGYDAERQYARVLLEWPPAKAKKIDFSIFVANRTDLAEIPPHSKDTIYLIIGDITHDWGKMVLDELKSRGSAAFAIHDSCCFACDNEGKGGCPGLVNTPLGCPNLGRDVRNGHPEDLERLYFTPWGSEKLALYPKKSVTPTMIVDATKSWTQKPAYRRRGLHLEAVHRENTLPAKAFVESMHKAFPESVSLVVLGDATISTPGITHHTNQLPRDDFISLLRSSWFYVSGTESSYELSLSDAAMAGAVLIDVANASKAAVSPTTTVHIDSAAAVQPMMADALKRYQPGALSLRTRKWALNFHGSQYLWLNLLCSLHADTKVDRLVWTKMQFNDTGVRYSDEGTTGGLEQQDDAAPANGELPEGYAAQNALDAPVPGGARDGVPQENATLDAAPPAGGREAPQDDAGAPADGKVPESIAVNGVNAPAPSSVRDNVPQDGTSPSSPLAPIHGQQDGTEPAVQGGDGNGQQEVAADQDAALEYSVL